MMSPRLLDEVATADARPPRASARSAVVTAGAALHRELFAMPRAGEFFDLRALQAQTGRTLDKFADVVVKELVDNALDACESSGRRPDVFLGVEESEESGPQMITVGDNGPGMTTELLDQLLDFSLLVSDKSAYRSPTRGSQGNALKTVLGIATAFGRTEPVIVESLGVRHEMRAGVDPAGHVWTEHEKSAAGDDTGTMITVTVGRAADRSNVLPIVDTARWARAFALVNPHAEVRSHLGHYGTSPEVDSYKPTVGEDWSKPLPTDPTSAHWYDLRSFERLVFSYIRKRDLPVGEFVRTFAGLTSTRKAKSVSARLDGVAHLSDLETHREQIAGLLAAMKDESRVPKASVLGRVPEEHYRACFEEWYGVERFWFARQPALVDAVPWVVEIAIAETRKPGEMFYAVNYSPTFDDPLTRLPFSIPGLSTTGARSFLEQRDAFPDGTSYRAAAIHVLSPVVEFLDKGKSTLAL
jgi:DNA topoisomerase VI subunit B